MQLVTMNDDKDNDVWVSCCHGNDTSFGCFLIKMTEKKTPSHSGKKKKTDHVYNGPWHEPKMVGWRWLFAEKKKLWKVALYKNRHFWPRTCTSVLPVASFLVVFALVDGRVIQFAISARAFSKVLQKWALPRFGRGEHGGLLSMSMKVILASPFKHSNPYSIARARTSSGTGLSPGIRYCFLGNTMNIPANQSKHTFGEKVVLIGNSVGGATSYLGLSTWRWGTPGRWGTSLRWGYLSFHTISLFFLVAFTCEAGYPT